jgi:GNAT superfamily N-acetyltransferase
MVELELIFPSDANATKLASMCKRFDAEYPKPTKSTGLTAKQRNKLAREDLDKEYSFWIKHKDQKIGFMIAPKVHRIKDDVFISRYLDTRYIEPEHRGQGFGSQAVELLEKHHKLSSNKLLSSKIHTPAGRWWIRKNFCMGVPCFVLDEWMEYERQEAMTGVDKDVHWFLYKKGTEWIEDLPSNAIDFSKEA